jgi:phosphonopyruvate decarboxylase
MSSIIQLLRAVVPFTMTNGCGRIPHIHNAISRRNIFTLASNIHLKSELHSTSLLALSPLRSRSRWMPHRMDFSKIPESPLTETIRDFLDPQQFYELLSANDMDFFCGVPDSLLKDFCAYVSDHTPATHHIIAANEGAGIGIAAGYHMSTGKYPVVYMQNSGFGNAINPILSLAHPQVYSIPMLLLVGWRGEPGKKDEPQHMVQGKVMTNLLSSMNIPFEVLPDYEEGAIAAVNTARSYLQSKKGPYVLLIKKQTFTPYKMKSFNPNIHTMTREQGIGTLIKQVRASDIIVGTTGFCSRELYEIREQQKEGHEKDFLTVGSMGHSSAIALGIAISKPQRNVFCIDGDGSLIMHMGTLTTIGQAKPKNLKHILMNNGAHDSVGGQPSAGFDVNWPSVAKSAGYRHVFCANTEAELSEIIVKILPMEGPIFVEVKVNKGARKDLGRPKRSTLENKADFMEFLSRKSE